jgi:hypothetical protein
MGKGKKAKPEGAGVVLPSLILTEPKTMESVETALLEWSEKLADLNPLQREIAKDAAKKRLKSEGYTSAAAMVNMAVRTVKTAQPVDGATVLTALHDAFSTYCLLPPHAAVALALWTLYTHVLNAFDYNPLLDLESPAPECGKSQVMEVLDCTTCRSMYVSGTRPAGIFRSIDAVHPTLLLDEVDAYSKLSEEYRNILDSAHRRAAAHIVRNVPGSVQGSWVARKFSTYSPIALGLIGTLPATIRTRSVVILMQRKLESEHIAPLGPSEKTALLPLKRKAIRWAHDNLATLRAAHPAMPKGLDSRAQDCWQALLAIADVCGGAWPTLAREAAVALSGREQREDDTLGITLLRSVRDVFGDKEKLPSGKILQALKDDSDAPWPMMNGGKGITGNDLARLLKPFGVKRKKTPLYFAPDDWPSGLPQYPPGGKAKGYERAAFLDAWARYLTDDDGTTGTTDPPQNSTLTPAVGEDTAQKGIVPDLVSGSGGTEDWNKEPAP